MNQSKYTPKPWILRKNMSGHWAIADNKTGTQFAGVMWVCKNFTSDELEANAHLIVKAPELLETVKLIEHIINICRRCQSRSEILDHLGALEEEARKTLATLNPQ